MKTKVAKTVSAGIPFKDLPLYCYFIDVDDYKEDKADTTVFYKMEKYKGENENLNAFRLTSEFLDDDTYAPPEPCWITNELSCLIVIPDVLTFSLSVYTILNKKENKDA